jgi:hypothetical protein
MKTVHLTLKSANVKTGPIPVSTTSALSCSDTCPFKKNGCYADGGPLALHWRAVTEGTRGTDWESFCNSIAALPAGQLWRHNQAGDLPGIGDYINPDALRMLTKANEGKRGFTYTHKPASAENIALVREANKNGFAINWSANNLAHADELAELNAGPVATIVPAGTGAKTITPAGRVVVTGPAQLREDISCADCQLCARADRPTIIGFIPHGTGAKKAEKISLQFQSKAL